MSARIIVCEPEGSCLDLDSAQRSSPCTPLFLNPPRLFPATSSLSNDECWDGMSQARPEGAMTQHDGADRMEERGRDSSDRGHAAAPGSLERASDPGRPAGPIGVLLVTA